MQLLLSGSL